MDTKVFDDHVQEMWFNGGDLFKDQVLLSTLGIAGEAGEVSELIKKQLRGDGEIDRTLLIKELGDVLFYITKLASLHGATLSEVMYANMEKLRSRKARGTMRGSGDNR